MIRGPIILTVSAMLGLFIAPLAGAERPNIVIIYADDLGYGDVSCYNPNGKIPTPHIDQLAKQGMRFTDAHASSSVCTPSRYSLLTGRYHWRTQLQGGILGPWDPPLIEADRLTLGSMLQQRGYRTACIGKWHLGWDWPIDPDQLALMHGDKKTPRVTDRHRAAWRDVFSQPIPGGPTARGFDTYFGTAVPNRPPFCFIDNDRTVDIPSTFMPPAMFKNRLATMQGPAVEGWDLYAILPTLTDRAVSYIAESARRDEPYFLYLPLTAPHTPIAVTEPWRGRSGLTDYADFVMQTDAAVGRVIDAIDQSGRRDNTLVVFTSDNGCVIRFGLELEKMGHQSSGPLRGYKSEIHEGGHRVPFIVRWPGVVEAGSVSEQLIVQTDLMATVAQIVRYQLPAGAGEDSVNLLPLLTGEDAAVRDTAIQQAFNGLFAIRHDNWKLIFGSDAGGRRSVNVDQPLQLYNLDQDLGERKNLYQARSQMVRKLTRLMREQLRSRPGLPQRLQISK